MSLSRSTMKAVAAGGLALSTITVGIVAAHAAPTALPVLSAASDGTTDGNVDAAADPSDGSAWTDRPLGRGPGGMRGEHRAALAEKLGVEEDALGDAMASLRETRREEGRAALAAALAEELGLEEEVVTAAMEELRTDHQARARTAFSARLDEAVEEGTLTEADKEAVLRAFDAGLLGRGPGGPR